MNAPKVAALALLLLATAAHAGKRDFFWVYDTEVVPERNVELEQWIWEAQKYDQDWGVTSVWWAPVIGLTDRVELVLPIEWYWYAPQTSNPASPGVWYPNGATMNRGTHFETAGVDLRWRLASPDPEEAGPLVPLLRFGVKRMMRSATDVLFEANGVLSYDPFDRLHLALDLGAVARTGSAKNQFVNVTWAAGASFKLNDSMRAGAETFGEYFALPDRGWNAFVGPDFTWAAGRFWLTGGVLFGLTRQTPTQMSRIIWGVAL